MPEEKGDPRDKQGPHQPHRGRDEDQKKGFNRAHKSVMDDLEEETTVPQWNGSVYNRYTYCSII
jgi:hypothetical protein